RLARAALAHQSHGLPLVDGHRHVVDGANLARGRVEVHRQVGDLEQAFRRLVHRMFLRGSKASRTASPMKINRLSMAPMTKNPVRPSHGACRLALPWASSSPSDAEP